MRNMNSGNSTETVLRGQKTRRMLAWILAAAAVLTAGTAAVLWKASRHGLPESDLHAVAVPQATRDPNQREPVFLPPAETRVVIPLPIDGDQYQCSISLSSQDGRSVILSVERPADSIRMSAPLSLGPGGLGAGGFGPTFCIGQGSELRFEGTMLFRAYTLVADSGDQLCFRRVKGGWAYVCGRGRVTHGEEVVSLGDRRTAESCVTLLAAPDAILREGGARALARLMTGVTPEMVPRLAALLNDPDPNVRRGAAEGLGSIGSAPSVEALQAALLTEKNKVTKEFIAEALALPAGRSLLGLPSALPLPPDQAAGLYSVGRTDWVDKKLQPQINSGGPALVKTLIARLSAAAAVERLAAVRLLGAGNCLDARSALTELSQKDPDPKVKESAREVAASLPTTQK